MSMHSVPMYPCSNVPIAVQSWTVSIRELDYGPAVGGSRISDCTIGGSLGKREPCSENSTQSPLSVQREQRSSGV